MQGQGEVGIGWRHPEHRLEQRCRPQAVGLTQPVG
jgi:hypothetical protein